ncbi:Crp/Fnr family transcriptional regulator [Kutzneria sp. 744]|uniref:Crp/Fnr family transcriptional regulator n=1 Tax=Kutzneria sp. (strain 744) TaxID=345341 RepID=UPI0003EEC8E3|nr:Crp/Fnr family transcriptional regulator [Kutzneria sp. 744]EWM16381.1 cyclic nucleotide-binding domain (cNMP-BD) protein [Kutzneria sp. 744]
MPVGGFRTLLSDEQWSALLDAGIPRGYCPGDELVRQGDPGGFVLVLRTGRVQVLRTEADGSRLLLEVRAAGDLIGEMAARGSGVRNATVVAVDQCHAQRVPVAAFDRLSAAALLPDYIVSKINQHLPVRVQLAHFTPPQKVARLLAELIALAGPELADPRLIPLSQQEIADALGLSRSSVAAVVADLRRDAVLGPGPRLTVLDRDGLLNRTSTVT